MIKKRILEIKYSSQLQPRGAPNTRLTSSSMAELVVFLPFNPGDLYFTWITPGNVKVAERALFRDSMRDKDGMYAFSGLIYPNMTSGVINDTGQSIFTIRTGNLNSGIVRVAVEKSIVPETSEVPPSLAQDLLDYLNTLEDEIGELIEQKLFDARTYFEYEFKTDFPSEGELNILYLAKLKDVNGRIEDYNIIYRWSDLKQDYIPLVGSEGKEATITDVELVAIPGGNEPYVELGGTPNERSFTLYFPMALTPELFDTKQDKLVAGDNITIDPNTNVISSRNDEPDGVTILLNEEGKLKINKNLEINGGFL